MLELNKIYNMDCIEGMKQIDDNSIDLVLTDPPYGINKKGITNDDLELKEYKIWLKEVVKEIDRVTNNAYFIFQSEAQLFHTAELFTNCRLFASCNNFSLMGRGMPYAFSPIVFKLKNGFKGKGRNWFISDTANMKTTPKKIGHPTPKPLDVLRYIITIVDANIILDPFIGSGSTAIASRQLNRHYIGFEIEKKYCQIAENRLKKIPEKLTNWIDIN